MKPCYVVVGSKSWNQRIFDEVIQSYPGSWIYIDEKDALTLENLRQWQPHYVFFLHWSYKVPEEVLAEFECVCFHMTDVPYGRGGSPLQNLIVRGHRETKLTALRMVTAFDAGPVYMKRPLSLEGSTAEELFVRATYLSAQMIEEIISEEPTPQAQKGEPTIFKRRRPAQSKIDASIRGLHALHDFIRMLDAETYPHAFLEYAGYRFEFTRAALYDGRIVADVTITFLEDSRE